MTVHEALNPIHPSVLPYLDPRLHELYNENEANTPNKPIDLAFLRLKYSVLYFYGTGPAPEPARVYDTTVLGHNGDLIPVRVYEPSSPVPWPVHIDYHGGGWGLGDLDTESHMCKHLAVQANVCVIDIDSFASLQHIYSEEGGKFNIDTTRVSLGGVSAGANIALILAHLAKDANISLKLVAVGTPVIDISQYAFASKSPYASVRTMEHASTLNWGRLKWFDNLKWQSLSSDAGVRKEQLIQVGWYKNAMNAPSFGNLPKTVIYTAGCDPLRDEGEAYAMKLVEGGNEVTLKRFEGVPHPFMHMDKDLWQASEFIDKTTEHIRIALH
ncbi:hypothetical protein BBP40_001195 [Aspergillus hancockii]|nr:hypothetical protein BBP40_001195 [Aspergillus hancockii]